MTNLPGSLLILFFGCAQGGIVAVLVDGRYHPGFQQKLAIIVACVFLGSPLGFVEIGFFQYLRGKIRHG